MNDISEQQHQQSYAKDGEVSLTNDNQNSGNQFGEENVPGDLQPDYPPTYTEIPRTGFSCKGKVNWRYYADIDTNCQVGKWSFSYTRNFISSAYWHSYNLIELTYFSVHISFHFPCGDCNWLQLDLFKLMIVIKCPRQQMSFAKENYILNESRKILNFYTVTGRDVFEVNLFVKIN